MKLSNFQNTRFDDIGLGSVWSKKEPFLTPEMIEKDSKNKTRESDIYAFGLLMYRLIYKKLPDPPEIKKNMDEKKLEKEYKKWLESIPFDPQYNTYKFNDIIKRALKKDPSKRISLSKVLDKLSGFDSKDYDSDERNERQQKEKINKEIAQTLLAFIAENCTGVQEKGIKFSSDDIKEFDPVRIQNLELMFNYQEDDVM